MKYYIGIFLFFISLGLYAQETGLEDLREKANTLEKQEFPSPLLLEEKKLQKDKTQGKKSASAKKTNRGSPFVRKFFEFGFDAGVGFANNWIGARDLLQKNITLDLDKLGDRINDEGLKLNTDLGSSVVFNIAPGGIGGWKVGFGVAVNISGGIYGNIPKSIFTLAAEGNKNVYSPQGDFTLQGGVFADTELKIHAKIKKLKIGITPAMYIPLIYIPKSSIHYSLKAEDSLGLSTSGLIEVYAPISLNMDEPLDFSETMIMDTLSDTKGFDLSLNLEYALLSFLDLGTNITHIPLSPATLNHRMSIEVPFELDASNLLTSQNLDIPDMDIKREYETEAGYTVLRPLRFDFYGNLKPFKTDILRLRPNIGFTVLTPSKEPYFNAGLDLGFNLGNVFLFHIGTGYEELLWKHRAGLGLNLRIFELDLELGLRSQDFMKSFQLTGFNCAVGIRFGF